MDYFIAAIAIIKDKQIIGWMMYSNFKSEHLLVKGFYSLIQSLVQDVERFPNAVIRGGRERRPNNILSRAQPRFINTIQEHPWGDWIIPLKDGYDFQN